MDRGTCADCVFSEEVTVDLVYLCRRRAPRPVSEVMKEDRLPENREAVWPRVMHDEWCGEWVTDEPCML